MGPRRPVAVPPSQPALAPEETAPWPTPVGRADTGGGASSRSRRSWREQLLEQAAQEPPGPWRGSGGGGQDRFRPPPRDLDPASDDDELAAGRGGRPLDRRFLDDKALEDEVEREERAARERLAKRLEAAARINPLPIEDGDEDDSVARVPDEKQEIKARLEENRNRYRKAQEEAQATAAGMGAATRAGQTGSMSGNAKEVASAEGNCVECLRKTRDIVGGSYCCLDCWQAWDEVTKKGWDGKVTCDGTAAALRAQRIVIEKGMTPKDARLEVMRLYPGVFNKAKR